MVVMSKGDRERMYTEFLRVEGYRPDLDEDGKVRFHRRGLTYTIQVDEMAEHVLVSMACWRLKGDVDRARVQKAALHANDVTKVARITLGQAVAFAEVSTFIAPPEGFKVVFGRVMAALAHLLEVFLQEMRKDTTGEANSR